MGHSHGPTLLPSSLVSYSYFYTCLFIIDTFCCSPVLCLYGKVPQTCKVLQDTKLVISSPLILCRSTLILRYQHLLISKAVFFSLVLKVNSSWTVCYRLVSSVWVHIALNLKIMSNFFFPNSFWYSGSGFYFKCETSLLFGVFYCWNHSQLRLRIQSEALCCSLGCFPSCILSVQVSHRASVSQRWLSWEIIRCFPVFSFLI